MHDKETPPEDKEKWNLDRERDADALKDYVRVERVIGRQKDDDGETEYLVKCMLSILFSIAITEVIQGEVFIMILARGKRVSLSVILARMRSIAILTARLRYLIRTRPNQTNIPGDASSR